MKHKSYQADAFKWHDRSNSWYLHGVVLTALVLNAIIAALAVVVQQKTILLPEFKFTTGDTVVTLRWLLPALATVLGFIINFVSMAAFKLIVDTYAKKKGLADGLSLKRIADLSKFSSGGLVLEFSRYLLLGGAILSIAAGTQASLTASLTPTATYTGSNDTFPATAFGTFGEANNLFCRYGNDSGYGDGCPVNDKYGVMFDAAILDFTGNVPEHYTRAGVSYPANLTGISGEISILTTKLLQRSTHNASQTATIQTVVSACVPRSIVTVDCKTNIDGTGLSWNLQEQLEVPASNGNITITRMHFCNSDGDCGNDTRPDYKGGTTFVFADRRTDTGHTLLLLLATGKQAETLGSQEFFCDVSTSEVLVPLIIRGQTVSQDPDGSCPDLPQAPPGKQTDITFMAQMGMQKMQGQDGRLEILSLVSDVNERPKALERAIRRMLSVGATEMYTRLPSEGSSKNVTYSILNERTRLASPSVYSLLWVIPPLLFFLILLIGWIVFGFSHAASVYWCPTDSVSMVVAGAAAKPGGALYHAMRNWAGADPEDVIKAVPGRIRLAEVVPGHLGLALGDVEGDSEPVRGQYYGGSMIVQAASPTSPMSPYKDLYSPTSSTQVPMPSPGGGYFPLTVQSPNMHQVQDQTQRWSSQGPY